MGKLQVDFCYRVLILNHSQKNNIRFREKIFFPLPSFVIPTLLLSSPLFFCHPRESGDPSTEDPQIASAVDYSWIPACAGMTLRVYEIPASLLSSPFSRGGQSECF